MLGRTEVYPASAFQRFEQTIIATAAKLSNQSHHEALQSWQRFRLERMFGKFHWSLMEPSFKVAYDAMVSEMPILTGEESQQADELRHMDAFLRKAKIQDVLLGLPQFALDDGTIGHLQLPAGDT